MRESWLKFENPGHVPFHKVSLPKGIWSGGIYNQRQGGARLINARVIEGLVIEKMAEKFQPMSNCSLFHIKVCGTTVSLKFIYVPRVLLVSLLKVKELEITFIDLSDNWSAPTTTSPLGVLRLNANPPLGVPHSSGWVGSGVVA